MTTPPRVPVHRRFRLLWLSHFVPFPPKGGCFQRSYNLIKRVGARHDLHLIALRHKESTHPGADACGARDELLNACQTVDIVDISATTRGPRLPLRALRSVATGTAFNVAVYDSPEVRGTLRRVWSSQSFDLVHFDTIGLAQYLGEVPAVPTVVTHHGAESHMVRRRIAREPNPLKAAYFGYEWLALQRYERAMCPRFDINIVMSGHDRQLMEAIAPGATYVPIDNGVDLEYFTPARRAARRRLIFAGRLDQYSNRDAILFFMREIWPRVIARYPDAVVDILGSNPPEALQRLSAADSRVVIHGFVPDVRPFFAEATAAICPIRDGGGTRIKVLDALAQGMPTVATSVACEGIAVVPERDLLIADTPDAFVRQLSRIFDEGPLREHLGTNGRRLIEERYSWDSLAARLMAVYEGLVGSAGVTRAAAELELGRNQLHQGQVVGNSAPTAASGPRPV